MSAPVLRVAFQGTFGAFSHEVCTAVLPEAEPVPYESFAEAIGSVGSGDCAFAVIPLANSIAGPVPGVADLLATSGLGTLAEHAWPIRIQLLGVRGGALGQVRTVASHPVALKQCGEFLRTHGLASEAAYDTAGAAAALAAQPDLTRAVAAPAAAAKLYGLEVLAADVQDRADNFTRFAVLTAGAPGRVSAT